MQKRKKTSQSGRLLLKTGISQNSLGTDFPPAHRCHLGLGHLSWGLLCCKRTPCHSHDFHPIDTSGNVKVSVTPWIPSGPPGSSVHEMDFPAKNTGVAISLCRGSFQPRDQTRVS